MSQPMRGKKKTTAKRLLTANTKVKQLTTMMWQCPDHSY